MGWSNSAGDVEGLALKPLPEGRQPSNSRFRLARVERKAFTGAALPYCYNFA